MNVQSISSRHPSRAVARPFARASLQSLLEQIAQRGDRDALREFHDHRTPFRLDGHDHPMSLTSYVTQLCDSEWAQRLCRHDCQVTERALDLTIDRFSAIPAADDGHPGPDCRHYFASVLQAVRHWTSRPDGASVLEVETVTARILQRRVTMHTWLCCKEALRMRHSARTRYVWRTATGDIPLWLPASLPSHRRRSWLAANIPDADASCAGESNRVQAIVDQRLGTPRIVPFADELAANPPYQNFEVGTAFETQPLALEFSAVIAEEKAQRIGEQRPAIRALGPGRLKQLILQIFQALSDGEYNQKELATAFRLSQPSLSRFAGQDWKQVGHVPDLWMNCAQVLAQDADYVECAIEAGVWGTIVEVLEDERGPNRDGRP